MSYDKDLIVLLADLDAENAVTGILHRPQSLGIRPISFETIRHAMRDPGCCKDAPAMLQRYQSTHARALVIFDRHGSGRDTEDRMTIEAAVEDRLTSSGWRNRCAAIVLDPELEAWVWSDSPEVDAVLGWQGKEPSLRSALGNRGFLKEDQIKPEIPKEAMEWALRDVRKARSARIFSDLAARVGLTRCVDPAFAKFTGTLASWFPERENRLEEQA